MPMSLTKKEYVDMKITLQRLKEDINKPVNVHNRVNSIKAIEMVLANVEVK